MAPVERLKQWLKAQPHTSTNNSWRIREDKVEKNGKVTLRQAGRWHDIGLGTEHAGIKPEPKKGAPRQGGMPKGDKFKK